MNAYDKIYLEDAMRNLAVMLDYGTMKEGDAYRFFERFKVSDVSWQFAEGNPKYLVGMSGIELAETVFMKTGKVAASIAYCPEGRSVEYWTGWVLAYFQWFTGLSFNQIDATGLTLSTISALYPTCHEADMSKFIQTALGKMNFTEWKGIVPLKRQRMVCGFTQQQLAERTGITLRMIQAYEQNRQDISRAEARTIIKLSKVLCCEPEDLIMTGQS